MEIVLGFKIFTKPDVHSFNNNSRKSSCLHQGSRHSKSVYFTKKTTTAATSKAKSVTSNSNRYLTSHRRRSRKRTTRKETQHRHKTNHNIVARLTLHFDPYHHRRRLSFIFQSGRGISTYAVIHVHLAARIFSWPFSQGEKNERESVTSLSPKYLVPFDWLSINKHVLLF